MVIVQPAVDRGVLSEARLGHGERDAVSNPVLGQNVGGLGRIVTQLSAELLHQGPHRHRIAGVPPAPKPAQQHCGRQHPSGVDREQPKELVLAGRQPHRLSGHGHPALLVLDGEVSEHEASRFRLPAQDRPHSGGQFHRRPSRSRRDGARNACSGWSKPGNAGAWSQPFPGDNDSRADACQYQWRLEASDGREPGRSRRPGAAVGVGWRIGSSTVKVRPRRTSWVGNAVTRYPAATAAGTAGAAAGS